MLLSVEDKFLSIMTHLLHLQRKEFWSGQIRYLVIAPLGGGNSNVFYFHPKNCWGNDPCFFVEHIFQLGWFNHQPDKFEKSVILFFPYSWFSEKNGGVSPVVLNPEPSNYSHFPHIPRWVGILTHVASNAGLVSVLVQEFDSVNSADVLSKIPSASCHFGAEKFQDLLSPFLQGCFFCKELFKTSSCMFLFEMCAPPKSYSLFL